MQCPATAAPFSSSLLLPDRKGRAIGRAVGTVDLAPTLATLLALPRTSELDGVDLTELVLAE